MNLMTTSFILACVIPMLVYVLAWFLSSRKTMDREKSSPFECGFDPSNNARVPFSMRFFLLAIIFIVFDIEIIILMPIPLMYSMVNQMLFIIITSTFVIILFMGLIHEWNQGSLDWSS